MKTHRTCAAVVGGILITLVVGLGGQTGPPYSGFLEDYPEMEPAPAALGGLMWEKPGLMGSNYTAIVLDQPEVFLHPDSSYKGIKSDQLSRRSRMPSERRLRSGWSTPTPSSTNRDRTWCVSAWL